MSATTIRNLLDQLTGESVRIFLQSDGRVDGTVAAVTEELVILANNDQVIWVDIDDVAAVRTRSSNSHSHDDDDDE